MSEYLGPIDLSEFLPGTPDPATPGTTMGQHFCLRAVADGLDGSAVLELAGFLDAAQVPDGRFLAVLQSDMDRGGFPDILAAAFSDPHWGHERRFCIPEVARPAPPGTREVAVVALELPDSGFLSRILQCGNGWRLSPSFSMWGVQLPEDRIPSSLPTLARRLVPLSVRQHVRTAFRFDATLTELYVYCAAGVLEGDSRLAGYLS